MALFKQKSDDINMIAADKSKIWNASGENASAMSDHNQNIVKNSLPIQEFKGKLFGEMEYVI